MFTGGDIQEISYKHPTIGSGTWFVKAGEDATVDMGGYTASDDEQMITGDGQMIDQLTRKRWSVETAACWDMATGNELDKARQLAASSVLSDWTFTHINGTVWGAKGKPVGDVRGSTKDANIKIKIAGSGILAKQ